MSSRKEYYVEYPANDRTGNNPQNTRDKSNYVFIRHTLDNAVDCPDYIARMILRTSGSSSIALIKLFIFIAPFADVRRLLLRYYIKPSFYDLNIALRAIYVNLFTLKGFNFLV